MQIDIGLLKIDGAVFHQVPAGVEGDTAQPVLSTVESKLDSQLEFFLRDRLTRTFQDAAQPIQPDDNIGSPTPDLVTAALSDGTADIVTPFHPLGSLLVAVQAHNSPKGLLSVIRGSCGTTPVIVLVKVEQERGLSFETYNDDGQVRVDVVVEDGLVFTDKTQVFKAALFYLNEDNRLVGILTDDQTGSLYRGPSSVYWLTDFLGCRYSREADVLTRAWIKATERLVRADLTDPGEKDAVLSAMLAELSSNRHAINPRAFIRTYVPVHAQDRATQRLRDEGAPMTQFPKSQDVSRSAPRRKRLEFDTGYEVRMPAEATPDLHSEDLDGVKVDVLTIRGRIRRVDT